ncbi:glycosyltransferase [Afifella pfennigii]|uniref:glycosyltransferase n=1 Tax=Afifella pfennigii TaxID=209897 RepID=UPI000479BBBC|nr:glycosyltransferase [Afifella pfennigii]
MDKRLIAVSWAMPPALYPRSIQVVRLLKGLSKLGWQSVVVTPRLADLPKTDILDLTLRDLNAGYYTPFLVDFGNLDQEPSHPLVRFWSRLKGAKPDEDEIWASRAAEAVRNADLVDGCDVLVTFAQPWRDHLVGLKLRRWRRGIPWIAHFSDPWVDNPYVSGLSKESRQLQARREAAVVRQADLLLFTNEYAADLVMRKYPPALRRKARVLPHAIDSDLRTLVEEGQPAEAMKRPLRLAYVGQLFPGRRTPNVLLRALSMLRQKTELAGRIELQVVGERSGAEEAETLAADLGLGDIVVFASRMSYLDSLREMSKADVLVLIDAPAETNVFFPSKLVDYMMMEKPILALTPQRGASADIVRELGYEVLDPNDPISVVNALSQALCRFELNKLAMSNQHREAVRQYEVPFVAGKFEKMALEAKAARGRRSPLQRIFF